MDRQRCRRGSPPARGGCGPALRGLPREPRRGGERRVTPRDPGDRLLQRERGVLEICPLAHRAVVVACAVVAEHAQDEGRERGPDATLSVGDGRRLRVDPRAFDQRADLVDGAEAARGWALHQSCPLEVLRARHVAGALVAPVARAVPLAVGARVPDLGRVRCVGPRLDDGHQLVHGAVRTIVDARLERRGLGACGRRGERSALVQPGVEAAIYDAHVAVAEVLEHPPHARGVQRGVVVVDDDGRVVGDAEAAQERLELRRGHDEPGLLAALEVGVRQPDGARDVGAAVGDRLAGVDEREVAADAVEVFGQPVGGREQLGLSGRHGSPPHRVAASGAAIIRGSAAGVG